MSTPLRDLITSLARDPDSRAAFAADPGAFLADHGWDGLDGADVGTALGALADEAPIEQATRLGELAAGDPFDDGLDGAIAGLGVAAAVIGEAPPPVEGDDGGGPLHRDPSLGLDVGPESGNGAGPVPGGADGDGRGDGFRLAPDHEPGEEPGEGDEAPAGADTGTDDLPRDAAAPDGIDAEPAAADQLPDDAAAPDGIDAEPGTVESDALADDAPDTPGTAEALADEPSEATGGETTTAGDGEGLGDEDTTEPALGDPLAGLGPAEDHEQFIQPDDGDGHVTDVPDAGDDDDL